MLQFPARRIGFTLVELLVTMAIMGILVALLMPAVQAARERARGVTCRNQMRQLGLGLHLYHDSHGCFPPGSFVMGPSFPMQSGWGWGSMILPSIDQRPLYDRIDFGHGTAEGPNLALIATPIPFWRCPSELDVERITVAPTGRPRFELASGNYCGSEGILSPMSAMRLGNITDGASQTFLLGERRVQLSIGGSLPYTSAWCGQVAFADGYEYRSVPHLSANSMHPINGSPTDQYCFGSGHPGGAFFVMGDGAVHFLSQNIDGNVFEALGTADGGEVAAVP